MPYDTEFESKLREKLSLSGKYSRGFGYWCWKPFIVLKTLENMEYGDILVYSDIGCHLKSEYLDIFYLYLDSVIEKDSLVFSLSDELSEAKWTKADLLNHFNILDRDDYVNMGQVMATYFYIKKTDKNIAIIREWLNMYYNHFSYIDDTPSKIPNLPMFIENRHDQSVFSILSKINNLNIILQHGNKRPILSLRDKLDIYTLIIYDKKIYNIFYHIYWLIPIKKYRDLYKNKLYNYLSSVLNNYFIEKFTNKSFWDRIVKLYFYIFYERSIYNNCNNFIKTYKY